MNAARNTTARTTRRRKALPRSPLSRATLAVKRAELNRRGKPRPPRRGSPRAASLISVLIRLVWPLDRYADIGGLLVRHFRELGADLGEMQPGDLLVETLRH